MMLSNPLFGGGFYFRVPAVGRQAHMFLEEYCGN